MMQTLFICPGNVDHRIKLPLIDLTCNELPYNPAAKGDQNAAGGAFNFPDKITQATLNLRQGDKRYQQQNTTLVIQIPHMACCVTVTFGPSRAVISAR